jgi:LuxR family maltose regulon positive regulatory protein
LASLRRRLRRRETYISLSTAKLTIQALGEALVVVGDRFITGTDWQSQGARDLFFFLLAQPHGLTKEAIGATFWPDYSPGRLKLHFKNTVYRLRRAVGLEAVLFDQDSYSFNRELDYEYDAETFLANLTQAQTATDEAARAAAYTAAVRLYKGPYLPEVEGTWVLPERERLSRAYLGALLKLAELRLAARDFKIALEYSQRALTEDPCLEEAHRLAMRVYAAMGNRAEVIRQFERCQETLRNEIDASPSGQTKSLYAQLSR